MIRTVDIAWLAGLLEGEAAFGIRNGSPIIQMQSTDRDVVKSAAEVFGVEFHDSPCKPRGPDHYKPVWRGAVHGTRAIQWMMTLFVLMGGRRQEKIREVIETWKASTASPRSSRSDRLPAVCHPDRLRAGGMLCKTCYMREYRHRTGKNTTYYRKNADGKRVRVLQCQEIA